MSVDRRGVDTKICDCKKCIEYKKYNPPIGYGRPRRGGSNIREPKCYGKLVHTEWK